MNKLNIIDTKLSKISKRKMYLIQGVKDPSIKNWISEYQLIKLMKDEKVKLFNNTNDTITINFVDIQDFEGEYDVNTFSYSIKYNDDELNFIELETKTYKKSISAFNYYNKLIKNGYYI